MANDDKPDDGGSESPPPAEVDPRRMVPMTGGQCAFCSEQALPGKAMCAKCLRDFGGSPVGVYQR